MTKGGRSPPNPPLPTPSLPAKPSHRILALLKPGKREYIFTTGGGTAYCQQPKIVRTACQPF